MEALEAQEKGKRSEWYLHFYPWWWEPAYAIPLQRGEHLKLTDEEKALVEKHKLSLAQINWRRFKQETFKKNPTKFYQEYPEDPRTCFLASGRSRFNVQALQARMNTQVMDPVEILMDGALCIYHPPVPEGQYVIGADPSEGIDADSGAAVVRRVDGRHNEQVATLHMSNFELVEFSANLYRTAEIFNHALVGVERNNHGHTVIGHGEYGVYADGKEIVPLYTNLYVHDDEKFGWHTNARTRPLMIDHLAEEYADPAAYHICDARIIHQGMRFVVVRGRAQGIKHDDLVMSDAIAGQLKQQPLNSSWFAIGSPDKKEDAA
jgi:hypothetical protein